MCSRLGENSFDIEILNLRDSIEVVNKKLHDTTPLLDVVFTQEKGRDLSVPPSNYAESY